MINGEEQVYKTSQDPILDFHAIILPHFLAAFRKEAEEISKPAKFLMSDVHPGTKHHGLETFS